METFAFWNNKGGTGKTSLAFQVVCRYAQKHPDKRVLIIDVCPQANLSELLLGGMQYGGSDNLLKRQGEFTRATIGGYFQSRLPSPYAVPVFHPIDFITTPSDYNKQIPVNIDLLCGDPLLELQANTISTFANVQSPVTDTWIAIIDWLRDFIDAVKDKYDIVFFDTNPSFSIYTQIALSAAERLILPVMADDSSRRAIQNVFSLIHGLKLPSEIYAKYAFGKKITDAGRSLPKVHLILKNRLTQYMGPASAFAAVLKAIDNDVENLLGAYPEIFTFNKLDDGIVRIRDFQTTGVVAHARGCPFYNLPTGHLKLMEQRVQIQEDYKKNCIDSIDEIVNKL